MDFVHRAFEDVGKVVWRVKTSGTAVKICQLRCMVIGGCIACIRLKAASICLLSLCAHSHFLRPRNFLGLFTGSSCVFISTIEHSIVVSCPLIFSKRILLPHAHPLFCFCLCGRFPLIHTHPVHFIVWRSYVSRTWKSWNRPPWIVC